MSYCEAHDDGTTAAEVAAEIAAACECTSSEASRGDVDAAQPAVDFVTYNVLSSSLCSPHAYPRCAREALDPRRRLERLLELLKERLACAAAAQRPIVIALQEVSKKWYNATLRAWLNSHGMRSRFASHGTDWDGRMGVVLAYSSNDLTLVASRNELVARGSASFEVPRTLGNNDHGERLTTKRGRSGDGCLGTELEMEKQRCECCALVAVLARRLHERLAMLVLMLSAAVVYGLPGVGRKAVGLAALAIAVAALGAALVWSNGPYSRVETRAPAADRVEDRRKERSEAEKREVAFARWLRARPASDPVAIAMSKRNRLLWMRLRVVVPSESAALVDDLSPPPPSDFCVATYHMPCVFQDPRVMVIHAALFAQRSISLSTVMLVNNENHSSSEEEVKVVTALQQQQQTITRCLPLALLGDFNSTPDSAVYELLTTGTATGVATPELPPSLQHWNATRVPFPFVSCYAAQRGGGAEPEATNYTFQSFSANGAFAGCLDYIFVNRGWMVRSALALPTVSALRAEAVDGGKGYLPTARRPSDHLLLAATVQLTGA